MIQQSTEVLLVMTTVAIKTKLQLFLLSSIQQFAEATYMYMQLLKIKKEKGYAFNTM